MVTTYVALNQSRWQTVGGENTQNTANSHTYGQYLPPITPSIDPFIIHPSIHSSIHYSIQRNRLLSTHITSEVTVYISGVWMRIMGALKISTLLKHT